MSRIFSIQVGLKSGGLEESLSKNLSSYLSLQKVDAHL